MNNQKVIPDAFLIHNNAAILKTANDHFFGQSVLIYLLVILLIFSAGCRNSPEIKSETGPVSPEHALATFDIEPGFKIELVVAEPLVSDPVDMEIDEYGRLYVVEMHGYPLDKSGSGKIKIISDTDGDGQMDKSVVFAEGLMFPNGIMRWKKGVLVTDAPNVLYLEDVDNDGKADIKDTILSGFSLSNPHVNVNNPMLGLDNWIYLAHYGAISTRGYQKEFGDKGSEIFYPDEPNGPRLPKNADSRSVRFIPNRHKLESTSSRAQFGHTFDAWGHRLLANNGNHAYQEVISNNYLKRNPDLLLSNATQSISDHGDVSEVFPTTKNPERQLFSGVGVMTSSSGVTAYLGGSFPGTFNSNTTFVCESVSNLVHADHLKDSGASFIASRTGRPHKEFLSSTDAWFRPVNMYVGPDGALYVLDYYRQIIEHPEWMSKEAIDAGGLYNGRDMGRIYRITSTNAKPALLMKDIRLGDATNDQLVEKLSDPNIWWRMNAQRLLVDRADRNTIPALTQMASNSGSAMGRLHALWTLEGISELKPALIKKALKDPVAGIRENAIKLAEIHLSDDPELTKALLLLQTDPDAKVRFQLLCTLGYINTPGAAIVRNNILFGDVNDKWVQIAALSASSAQTASLLQSALDRFSDVIPAYSSLVERLSAMMGTSAEEKNIHQLIHRAAKTGTEKENASHAAIYEGLAQGLANRKLPFKLSEKEEQLLIATFFEHRAGMMSSAALQLIKKIGIHNESLVNKSIAKAMMIAGNRKIPDDRRVEAIQFVAIRNPVSYSSQLKEIIFPGEKLPVQLAALAALSTIPDSTAALYILQQWSVLTTELRDAALNAFLVSEQRITILLDAIESNIIQQSSLGWQRTSQLMNNPDEKLRNRARSLFTKNNEESTNKEYEHALKLKGSAINGKAVYLKNCAICHQVRGSIGVSFGPDLGTVHNWLPENIMANILAPNQSIAAGFDLWSVQLKNGESIQGILSTETSAAVTFRVGAGIEKTVNRQDIKSLKAINTSAMPDLSKQLDQQQMADLIAFLRENK